MGSGSQFYWKYYRVQALIYLAVSLWGAYILLASAGDCQLTCPLYETYIDEPLERVNCGEGFCSLTTNDNYPNGTCDSRSNIFIMPGVTALEKGCFICNGTSSQVLWNNANDRQAKQKWQPANACEGIEYGPGVVGEDGDVLCYSVPNKVSLRRFTVPGLWMLILSYGFQALGCFVCSIILAKFTNIYPADWKKLSQSQALNGAVVKYFPQINRIINLVVAGFIGVAFYMIFVVEVCNDSRNKFGNIVFYPSAQYYLSFVIGIYILTCGFGTYFRNAVYNDTAFIAPRRALDQETTNPVVYHAANVANIFTRIGP